jgi:hypothetical protein
MSVVLSGNRAVLLIIAPSESPRLRRNLLNKALRQLLHGS